MKAGILGSGAVGQYLSKGFAKYGYQVMMGTRNPDDPKIIEWLSGSDEKVKAGTFSQTSEFGDILVLATLWTGTESAINLAGKENFKEKILIDATNPLDFSRGLPPSLYIGHTDSGGEQVQRWLPDTRVVKAFNIVGHANMVDPEFPEGKPDMFICGNDAGAKKEVTKILNTFGWPFVTDIGDISGARELESLCILWVKYAIISGQWNHAFKVVKK